MHGGSKITCNIGHLVLSLERLIDDFVINISNIAYVLHLVATGPQPTLDYIKSHEHTCMTEMTVVIYRHPTDIHADLARLVWFKEFFFTLQRVINVQHEKIINK